MELVTVAERVRERHEDKTNNLRRAFEYFPSGFSLAPETVAWGGAERN
jgi:hypothetical protein